MLKNKAQASIEVMISILIVLFLFTLVFLASIMKGSDVIETESYIKHRESCIALSSMIFMASIFDYSSEISMNTGFEVSRDKGLLNVYKVFCYGYTRELNNIIYQGNPGKFTITKNKEVIKIGKL